LELIKRNSWVWRVYRRWRNWQSFIWY